MEIITRKEAISKGLVRYFTGKKCKYGHITERYSRNNNCVACSGEQSRESYKNNIKKINIRRNINKKKRRESKAGRPKPEICEACNQPHNKIVFDHCHTNGHFRGWICDDCNVALGRVKDNIDTLLKLAKYLQEDLKNVEINNKRQEGDP